MVAGCDIRVVHAHVRSCARCQRDAARGHPKHAAVQQRLELQRRGRGRGWGAEGCGGGGGGGAGPPRRCVVGRSTRATLTGGGDPRLSGGGPWVTTRVAAVAVAGSDPRLHVAELALLVARPQRIERHGQRTRVAEPQQQHAGRRARRRRWKAPLLAVVVVVASRPQTYWRRAGSGQSSGKRPQLRPHKQLSVELPQTQQ